MYVTHPDKETAEKIVTHLLKTKRIACANLFPIESIYTWKGKKEQIKEIVSLLKTKEELWEELKKEIENMHPYQTPCIIKIHADANPIFTAWIEKETKEKK